MPDVIVVRGTGGGLIEIDRPTRGHAADLFEQRLAAGELTIVTDPVEWVDVPGGGRKLQLATVADAAPTIDPEAPSVAQEPRRRGRPPKVRDDADSAPEADDTPEE